MLPSNLTWVLGRADGASAFRCEVGREDGREVISASELASESLSVTWTI